MDSQLNGRSAVKCTDLQLLHTCGFEMQAPTAVKAREHVFVWVTTYSFEKFVDWRQGAAVMQREAVTVMPSCSGAGNAVVV
jgi:hypothetical protein